MLHAFLKPSNPLSLSLCILLTSECTQVWRMRTRGYYFRWDQHSTGTCQPHSHKYPLEIRVMVMTHNLNCMVVSFPSAVLPIFLESYGNGGPDFRHTVQMLHVGCTCGSFCGNELGLGVRLWWYTSTPPRVMVLPESEGEIARDLLRICSLLRFQV